MSEVLHNHLFIKIIIYISIHYHPAASISDRPFQTFENKMFRHPDQKGITSKFDLMIGIRREVVLIFWYPVFLLLLAVPLVAQKPSSTANIEYIVRDSGKEFGSIQFNAVTKEVYFRRDTSKRWKVEDSQHILSFKDEKNIYSKELLNFDEIFLIELTVGEVSLYQLGDSLFVKSEDQLTLIQESTLHSTLDKLYAHKPTWAYNKARLKNSKSYLVHLVRGYNRSDHFKSKRATKGINFQTNYSTYVLSTTANSNNQSLDLDPVASYTFGLKLEYPSFKGTSTMISFNFFNQHEHTSDIRGGVSQESQMILIGVEPRFYIHRPYSPF